MSSEAGLRENCRGDFSQCASRCRIRCPDIPVYAHYLTGLGAASARLATFTAQAARASATGQAFDDAATVHGLLGFFRRGRAAGALLEDETPPLLGHALP